MKVIWWKVLRDLKNCGSFWNLALLSWIASRWLDSNQMGLMCPRSRCVLQHCARSYEEASWGSLGKTWLSGRRVRSGLELKQLRSEGKNGWKRGRRGSTESITQLSAGVMFSWINLLWNVQVLPGLMPCVRWRPEKKREWLERGCGNVMKRDLKRRIPPQGLSASFPATLSPLYYSVLTYSSTHASNIRNTRHIWKPMGSRMYRRHIQQHIPPVVVKGSVVPRQLAFCVPIHHYSI